MRKVRLLELMKVGNWGLDGAPITKQDIKEAYETFVGPRPVVIGHEGARDDTAPKFGDVLDLVPPPPDYDVLKGHVSFLEAADPLYEGGYYDGWSVSIPPKAPDGKKFLHHLAILGAVPPKIPGLRELAGVDYSDAGAEYTFEFSGKIPEEVEEVDGQNLQEAYDALFAKFTAMEEEFKKLKAGAPAGGPAGAAGGEAEKSFADQIGKMNAELKGARVSAFSDKVGDKVPAGILAKAMILADRIGDGEAFEFSDGETDATKKRTARPIELLGEILAAWPASVDLGRSGNDYSDAKGPDGKTIDWNALAAKA